MQGKSEPLIFDFKNKKMDSFCKWNGENPEEFYRILDMFIELKPLFKSLKIDDDLGLWHEYANREEPCKIDLRPLTSYEIKMLERIIANDINPPTELEKLVMAETGLMPHNKALLRAIVQDFIEIMNIISIDDFKPKRIIELANKLEYFGKDSFCEELRFFSSHFSWMLIEIWISFTFEYKKMGIVKNLPNSVRGLMSSKIAAFGGIRSIFLNQHSGGASNSKEAEMRKLAKKYYRAGALGEVMVIDRPERELEFLFSMMDFLGFNFAKL